MVSPRKASFLALTLLGTCHAQSAAAAQEPEPQFTFGTTVVSNSGFTGQIYYLKPGTEVLPNFKKMKPKGKIYTTTLNVPPRSFTQGFPGLTDRFEWFAIQYEGKFWVEKPGNYDFALTSDDGSKLHIDDKMVIYNDGIHPPVTEKGNVKLTAGVHKIRVSYFQGPRAMVALVLAVAGPDERWHIFDANDFLPPAKNFPDW